MSQRITIQVEDGVTLTEASFAVSAWVERNERDPVKNPMTGIVLMQNGVRVARRDYRKGLCFVAWRDNVG